MNEYKNTINNFLVSTFNRLIRREERSLEELCGAKISVKEFHVIEAIRNGVVSGKNTMGDIAGALDVTMGTLTAAVKTLEGKGLVKRNACVNDKRSFRLDVTPLGEELNKMHVQYHEELIERILGQLSAHDQKILAECLETLEKHFMRYSEGREGEKNG